MEHTLSAKTLSRGNCSCRHSGIKATKSSPILLYFRPQELSKTDTACPYFWVLLLAFLVHALGSFSASNSIVPSFTAFFRGTRCCVPKLLLLVTGTFCPCDYPPIFTIRKRGFMDIPIRKTCTLKT